MKIVQGHRKGKGLKLAIIASRFNNRITDRLLSGALEGLQEAGVAPKAITVVWVPGAFELAGAAKRLAESNKPDAIVCLGAVIRGETEHFTYVSKAAQEGVLSVALSTGIPITFGVLTTETVDQAISRSSATNNKGREAAGDAVEMANLYRQLK